VSVAIYMNHHVRAAVTAGLRRRGVDVLTARDDGNATAEDDVLLARSTALNRVLFSQDDDLLSIAAGWLQSGRPFFGLVYAHQLNATVGSLVHDLELIAKAFDLDDMRNQIQFIPFR
jgi:predicted nuclease of predicted toxin-antitoxin system